MESDLACGVDRELEWWWLSSREAGWWHRVAAEVEDGARQRWWYMAVKKADGRWRCYGFLKNDGSRRQCKILVSEGS